MSVQIDKIIRSNRRTFSLEIDKSAQLIVRVPKGASLKQINEIVNKRKDWIIEKQNQMKSKNEKNNFSDFLSKNEVFYLGKKYPIIIKTDVKYAISFDENAFLLNINHIEHKERLIWLWLNKNANHIISERISFYSELMVIKFNQLKISNANKRWGSCSSKKNININWRLVIAPMEVLDYVIVHELAHILQMNHSPLFWRIVAKYYPNFRSSKKWLKDNSNLLEL